MYTHAQVALVQTCTSTVEMNCEVCNSITHRQNQIVAYCEGLYVSPLFMRAQETVFVDPSMYAQDASHIM